MSNHFMAAGWLLLCNILLSTGAVAAQAIPEYRAPVINIAGKLKIVDAGDAMPLPDSLALALADYLPQVEIETVVGAPTEPEAWWDGENTVAVLSAPLQGSELAAYKRLKGFEPTALPIALQAIAVIAHPENPVRRRGLSLAEIDAIFSSTRNRGHADIRFWSDLDIDNIEPDFITLYSPDMTSNLQPFFVRAVLQNGEFKSDAVHIAHDEVPETILDNIGGDINDRHAPAGRPNAIGYLKASQLNTRVAAVPVAEQAGQPPVALTPENVANRSYPLTRYVYLHFNRPPDQPLLPLQRELLRFVFSRQGQELIAGTQGQGYVAMPVDLIVENLRQAGLGD